MNFQSNEFEYLKLARVLVKAFTKSLLGRPLETFEYFKMKILRKPYGNFEATLLNHR